jgi:MATE family, multidrug efflux pump
LQTEITYKKIWNIAYPIILGSVAQNIITATDTAFLGRVGEIALGASAIGGIFYLAVFMLGWGLGIGSQIIIARRDGENKQHKIGSIIEHSHIIFLFLAIIIFVLIQNYINVFLISIIDSKEVFTESAKFLRIRSFGIFFAFINVSFRALFIGISNTKIITWSTIGMAIVNITLDYILIFGKFGFTAMGIEGAALASVIAEITACTIFIVYTLVNLDLDKYQLFKYAGFEFKKLKNILNVSFPMMLQNFISLSGWFIFFLLVEKLGETSLAISNIIRSIYLILMIPIWGFASSANTLVSFVIGQGNKDQVMQTITKIVKLCVISVGAIISVAIFFPEELLRIYSNDTELIKESLNSFYVVCGSAFTIAVGFNMFSAVSGTGKTNISLYIEIAIIALYLAGTFILVKVMNATIAQVWTMEYFYGLSLTLFSFIYLKFGKWRTAKI